MWKAWFANALTLGVCLGCGYMFYRFNHSFVIGMVGAMLGTVFLLIRAFTALHEDSQPVAELMASIKVSALMTLGLLLGITLLLYQLNPWTIMAALACLLFSLVSWIAAWVEASKNDYGHDFEIFLATIPAIGLVLGPLVRMWRKYQTLNHDSLRA